MQPGLIRIEDDRDAGIVVTSGELDLSMAPSLSAAIATIAPRRAIVSLVECTYIDSTILTVLVKSTAASDGRLTIVLPAGHRLRRIFEIANLNHILDVASSLDEAIARDAP